MNLKDLQKNIEWIYHLKDKIPKFLRKLKGNKRSGFYRFSLSGDYFGERIKWGLGNAVYFLKIIFTLGLEKKFKQEVIQTIRFLLSFQRKDGTFYDPFIKFLSFPWRLINAFKSYYFANLRNQLNKRAETRQSVCTLLLFNIKTCYEYKNIPKTEREINKFLSNLNWKLPWGAGSHISHLLFFLNYSNIKNKEKLIKYAIDWINKLQHKEDGFWYRSNPSIQQKINGAMKIITGLKIVERVNFKYPKKIIDKILSVKNDNQACDNFNIVYVLKYCNEITQNKYRYTEIKDFMYTRLEIYKQYYYPGVGGFSFHKNKASTNYYGAIIGRGKNEPDIHGTVLFLWGICLIAQTLKINDKLHFKESII